LANSMSAVLCLHHDAWCPVHFRKDNRCRSSQCDALRTGSQGKHPNHDIRVILESAHSLISLGRLDLSIDPDVANLFLNDEILDCVHHIVMMSKNDKFYFVLYKILQEFYHTPDFGQSRQ